MDVAEHHHDDTAKENRNPTELAAARMLPPTFLKTPLSKDDSMLMLPKMLQQTPMSQDDSMLMLPMGLQNTPICNLDKVSLNIHNDFCSAAI